jgi:hypothetical protein
VIGILLQHIKEKKDDKKYAKIGAYNCSSGWSDCDNIIIGKLFPSGKYGTCISSFFDLLGT